MEQMEQMFCKLWISDMWRGPFACFC